MVDFLVKIEFDELDFVILPISVLKKYTMKNEFIELIFHTWKTSSTNSSSIHGKGVQRTRLPYKENEFVELVFLVYFFFTTNATNMI